MGKKRSGSSIENRVYLFKDLVGAFLIDHGELLASPNPAERSRALRAIADLAHASCVVADTSHLDAAAVAELVAAGAPLKRPAAAPQPKKQPQKAQKQPAASRKKGGGAKKTKKK